MVRLLFWSFEKCGVSLHFHYFKVHSYLEWSYLLGFSLKIICIWLKYLIPYNCELFVLIVTWRNYNCFLRIVISDLKPYITVCKLFVLDRNTCHNCYAKRLFRNYTKNVNTNVHHHVTLPAWISLTHSHHPSLSSIAPGRSSRLYPVLAQSCCI